MTTAAPPSHALVFGGTGAVGSEVLKKLRERGIRATFTYRSSDDRARALAAELDHRAVKLDLAEPAAIRALIAELCSEAAPPGVFIHCAAMVETACMIDMEDPQWDRLMAVNCRSAFVACRELSKSMAARGGGDIVIVGALDRGQSLPVPVGFAACQGTLAAMTMAMAKELGPAGVRVNMVALGLLDSGLSLKLDRELREAYLHFSALRRFGKPCEAAATIVWLALDNRYMSGKVAQVSGGI